MTAIHWLQLFYIKVIQNKRFCVLLFLISTLCMPSEFSHSFQNVIICDFLSFIYSRDPIRLNTVFNEECLCTT